MRADKQNRQRALVRLVRTRRVGNQVKLVELLRQQGIEATQASISRDLRELGIVKLNGHYVSPGNLHQAATVVAVDGPIGELISSAEPVGANLIVIRTRIGAAGPVAVELDARELPEVAGTVAGDDTVFVAVRSRSAQGRVLALLRKWAR